MWETGVLLERGFDLIDFTKLLHASLVKADTTGEDAAVIVATVSQYLGITLTIKH